MSIDTVKAHRDEILAIATLHGATNVRVFGSVVRGEDGPDSDVDFLVDLESGRSLLDLAKLLVDLEHLLHLRVDVVTENGLRPHVKEPILREAVAL